VSSIPPLLWHYTNGDGLLGIVREGRLWATRIDYLNDSKEFAYAIDLVTETVDRMAAVESAQDRRRALDEIRSKLTGLSQLCDMVAVASFSEAGDSLSQWRAYCHKVPGYSLGFDTERLAPIVSSQRFVLSPCIYNVAKQTARIEELVAKAMLSVAADGPTGLSEGLVTPLLSIAPILKHPSFEGEREWRLVSDLLFSGDPKWKVRVQGSMLVPYVEIELVEPDGGLPVCELRAGPTPHPELALAPLGNLIVSARRSCVRTSVSSVPFRSGECLSNKSFNTDAHCVDAG